MKILLILTIFLNLVFAKININQADRYELMTIGELDAGRADMLIKYREKKEIVDANQLSLINGFGGYDTSKLTQNFDIQALPKEKIEVQKPTQKQEKIIVVEKRRVVNQPIVKKRVEKYGNIEISETTTYPPRSSRKYGSHHRFSHPKHIHQNNSEKCYGNNGNICVNGEINFKFEKNL